ncbi:MAG: signal recognition particle-docking protein FtsY [Myxococcota bacterium]
MADPLLVALGLILALTVVFVGVRFFRPPPSDRIEAPSEERLDEASAEPGPGPTPRIDAVAEPEPEPEPESRETAPSEPVARVGDTVQAPEEAPPEAPPSPPPPSEAEEPAAQPTPATSLKDGLVSTRKGFMSRLNALLFSGGLDDDAIEELEALLVTSDIGIRTAQKLLDEVQKQMGRSAGPTDVRNALRRRISELIDLSPPSFDWSQKPLVWMVIGVNGVGKTTTIGKLSARFVSEGKKVVLAAGDTFRAAAVEQLEVWGTRTGATVVKGVDKADPASVIYDAISLARRENADVCICDTAGRLHTKVNLMEELKKVKRSMSKALEGSPHEVMMVLDATTGQNAIVQAKEFKQAVDIDSIALTKLDGTAKGGVVVAISDELQIPVRYIGIGEKVEDLRDFEPEAFVEALFDDDEERKSA